MFRNLFRSKEEKELKRATTLLAIHASSCLKAQEKYQADPTPHNMAIWQNWEAKVEVQIDIVQQKREAKDAKDNEDNKRT